MLKKRILASSLASVMALSSVSVVAFADETATADYGETVTKSELKEYVASFDDFVKKELPEYGTVQTQQFNNALKYAKNISSAKDPADEEVVAAYQMLKNIRESMQMYSADQLKDLVEDCKEDYETKNVLNAAFKDKIWKVETFTAFEKAYKAAAAYKGSDSRAINDLYVNLKIAADGLTENESVTKQEFRDVYTQYMNLAASFKNYETWRRGVCTVNPTTGNAKKNATDDAKLTDAKFITYGDLQTIVYGDCSTVASYQKSDNTPQAVTGEWIYKDLASGTIKAGIEAQYEAFLKNATSNKTTKDTILQAYNAAKDAIAVFEGWQADDTDWMSDIDIDAILEEYNNKLVKDYAVTTILNGTNGLTSSSMTVDGTAANTLFEIKDGNKLVVKASANLTKVGLLKIDDKTGKIAVQATTNADKYNDGAVVTAGATKEASYLKDVFPGELEEGSDLTEYVPINSVIVAANGHNLATALKAYEAYCAADDITDDADTRATKFKAAYTDHISAWDGNKTITEGTGSLAEYTFIYRKIKYALEDTYKADDATYTLSDVEDMMAQSIELINETGDAEMFKTLNANLAKEYNAAAEWVSAAKAWVDYEDGKGVNYSTNKAATDKIKSGKSSTDVYKVLKDTRKKLADLFAKYPYSYAEVAETIAYAAEGLEDGVYGSYASDIKALVTKLSISLSTLDADGKQNEPFDAKRNFIGYNRTYKDGTDAEKALIADYKELLATMEKAEEEPGVEVVPGDLDGDGIANAKDALLIVQASVGEITLTDEQKAAADFNGDGNVNAQDALAIVVASLG